MIELKDTPEQMLKRLAGVEAGYVNNPDDRGGETNHGVTKAVALENKNELIKRFGWDGTMRNLSESMALWLFKARYWDKLGLDMMYSISPTCADKMLDIGVNSGVGAAGMYFQKFLNVLNNKQTFYADLVLDGAPGSKTYQALDALIVKRGKVEVVQRLAMALLSYQTVNAIEISIKREANETFTWGWLNRQWDSVKRYTGLTQ